ncbi:substrate-binding domain-containing protein [Geomonas subterranea]|uniref:substrate-binding domain-containing protein n=1 Tax=Geomonas subterranea TaxID=2847989 RepID=UPI001CD55941|nr:substrate-binding domain-containing protein [Geomonas fuzhouensis]
MVTKAILTGCALVAGMTVFSGMAAAETVRLHGSTTVQKRIMEPGKDALKKATGIDIVLVGNGTGNGVEDLVAGKCDAAMASEELADAVASMKDASGKAATGDLKPNVITDDIIKVIVNPANPVTKLSKEQLKGLHNGTIDNWSKVGGSDLSVIVVTSHLGSATRKVFQKSVMEGTPYVAGALEVETTRKEIDNVSQFPEGIGAVSMGFINLPGNKEKVKIVDTPVISRPLMLITKGDPSPAVQKIVDFFKGEGKKYIKD